MQTGTEYEDAHIVKNNSTTFLQDPMHFLKKFPFLFRGK